MKRTTIIQSFILFFVIISSCGTNNTQYTDSDSTLVVDSTSLHSDSSNVSVEDVATDTIDSIFKSKDLKKFYLRGNVKMVTPIDYAPFVSAVTHILKYDTEGNLISEFSDLTDNKLKLNENDQISYTSCRESDGTTFELEFYEWDENLNPVAGKYKADSSQEIWEVTFAILYNNFDSKGNWLSRTFKGKSTSSQMDINGDIASRDDETFELTETRKINYW